MASKSNGGRQAAPPHDFFQKLASGIPGVLFTYWLSADGTSHRYPFVSDQIQKLFGVPPALLNENADVVFSVIHPEDVPGVGESILESAKNLTPWIYQARLKLKSGEFHWFEAHSEPERQPDGSTLWYGQFHDIQRYKVLEQSLRDSEAEFSFQAGFQNLIARLSTEFINLGFGTIDECIDELLLSIGRFFQVDRAYLYAFSDGYDLMSNTHEWCAVGVPSLKDSQKAVPIGEFYWWRTQIDAMVERNQVVFIEDVDRLPDDAVLERALLQEQGVSSMFCVPIRIRGRVTGFFGVDSLRKRDWRTDQGDLLIIVSGLLSGALERHRLEEELLSQSILDPLTGLHNRRYLIPRLQELLARSNRQGEPFALAMFDIDHFKKINDSVGHLGGDFILQGFAELLRQHTRTTDVISRFGGEEFLVVFAGVDASDAKVLVMRVLEAVRKESFIYNGHALPLTASAGVIGVGELTGQPVTPDLMIDHADHRLYLAKQRGRDCVIDGLGI
ncbi:diguanylate cyclase [Marinobacter sp. SS5-14b]|uniref:sensor domain-containing diguanylate cyclase n=1 Tax=Marinobacter sp. SS5-14b TaxID=3050456 RepID=UPI0026DFA0E2|nr:diguanylate cyclase [Marinobacter sp. SS5-14b]